ncbi:MAG: VanW family protein [Ruminococcus sp.]|nr:VanW family protein [Ruminococcus sp.]
MRFGKDRKLFCEISPTTHMISEKKESLKKHIKDMMSKEKIARNKSRKKLRNVVSAKDSQLIKKGKGIDPVMQENKAVNINLACKKLNGLVIHPGETFSFWQSIGPTTKRRGYKDGRVLINGQLYPGIGGGLCNLANVLHNLVLLSPLDVTEFHEHSDALAPDHGERVPFSAGTSVSYYYNDYRFKNNTDMDVQLVFWCDAEELHGELRSEREFPNTYSISEEDHHFEPEGDEYYRISKIYKNTFDRQTGELVNKELVLDNHSKVLFDHSEIPKELIRV